MEWMWCRKWESWAQRKEHLPRSLSSPSVGSFSFSIDGGTIHHLHRMTVTGLSQWTGLVCSLKLSPHIGVEMWDEAGMVRTWPCIFVTSVDQFQAFVNNYMMFFYVCFGLHYVVFQCAGSLRYNCASHFLLWVLIIVLIIKGTNVWMFAFNCSLFCSLAPSPYGSLASHHIHRF